PVHQLAQWYLNWSLQSRNCARIRCCLGGFYQSENHRLRPDAGHSVFLLKCRQRLLQSGYEKYGQISPPQYSPHPAQSGIQLFHATMKYAVGHHNLESIQAVAARKSSPQRSEEHTSELQSRENLVCRLLREK